MNAVRQVNIYSNHYCEDVSAVHSLVLSVEGRGAERSSKRRARALSVGSSPLYRKDVRAH